MPYLSACAARFSLVKFTHPNNTRFKCVLVWACVVRRLGGNGFFYQSAAKMKSSVKAMLVGLKRTAVRRPGAVVTQAMGRKRVFHAYDFGDDTMVLEKGVLSGMDAHASVLLAEKSDQIIQESFRLGVGTFLQIQDTQNALLGARLSYYQAIYNLLVAQSNLEFTLGNAPLHKYGVQTETKQTK